MHAQLAVMKTAQPFAKLLSHCVLLRVAMAGRQRSQNMVRLVGGAASMMRTELPRSYEPSLASFDLESPPRMFLCACR